MDPDETLRKIRELCREQATFYRYDELAEYVQALDEWISHGGIPAGGMEA
jgi:hypothetical protein